MKNPEIGDYAVFYQTGRGETLRHVLCRRIARATAATVWFDDQGWPKMLPRYKLLAVLPGVDEARLLTQSIDGAAGQYRERARKARADYDARLEAADLALAATVEKLIKKATEQ